jgi:hypothetical protein
MRKKISTFHIQTIGLCCLIGVGLSVFSADGAPEPAGVATSIPNMACTPTPLNRAAPPPGQWDECVGSHTFPNGNSYRGEFRHGMRTGFGVLMIKYIGSSDYANIGWHEPAIYIGDFGDGRLNGYGLLIGKSGVAYAAMFKDNIPLTNLVRKECRGKSSADWTNCVGTYHFSNGNVYRGEFADGLPDGIGMLQVKAIGRTDAMQVRLPAPGIYVGQFKDGKLSGQGAVVMPAGGYFGTFRDNEFKLATGDRGDSRD